MPSRDHTLPAGLEFDRVLATSDRSTVLLVRRGAERLVLRIGEDERSLATEVVPFSRLDDPGLVAPTEWGRTADGRPYSMRSFVEGTPFDAAVRGAPVDQVVASVRSLLSTLASLHDSGFVHRDVKASNVLVGPDHTYLIDLELAILWPEHGAGAGSPFHLAPEILLGHPHRPQADLFSVGAMVAFALCGRPADSFRVRFPSENFWSSARLDPQRIPAALRPLVTTLVRRHPHDRVPSARHAIGLLPDSPPSVRIRPTLPFLAYRAQYVEEALRRCGPASPVVIVSVSDEAELDAVTRELRLHRAMTERGAADAGGTIDVESASLPSDALLETLRRALLEPERRLVCAVPKASVSDVLDALAIEFESEERAGLAVVEFPRVTAEALEAHLLALSDAASPKAARSLSASLVEQCDGRRSEINLRLWLAETDGVLRRLDTSYALLRDEWPPCREPDQVFAERVAKLSRPARALLRAVASLGEDRATLADVARVAGLDPSVVDAAFGELLRSEALSPGFGAGGSVLVRDRRWLGAAASGMTSKERRVQHQRCIEVLAGSGADAGEIAQHELAVARTDAELDHVLDVAEKQRSSGHLGSARALAQVVAKRARNRRAVRTRAIVLQARLEIGQGNGREASRLLVDLFGPDLDGAPSADLLVAAEAAELCGRRTEARGLYERALDLEPTDPADRLRAVVGIAYALWLDGNPSAALQRTAGLPTRTDPDEPAGALLNLRAGSLADLGRYEEAYGALDAAMLRARRSNDPTLIGRTELNRAYVDRRSGSPQDAVSALQRAIAAFDHADHVKMRALAANNLGVLERDLGRMNAARALLEQSLALRRRLGDAHGTAVSMANLGIVALDCGELGSALSRFERARVRMIRGGYSAELGLVEAHTAVAHARVGRTRDARACLAKSDVDSTRKAKPLLVARAAALIELASGQRERAAELLARALRDQEHRDVAETFRTARLLCALRPDDELARTTLQEGADRLGSESLRSEVEWLTRERAVQHADAMANWLREFERSGRTDLVHVVATQLARSLHGAGRRNERRQAMRLATAATDALLDGMAEDRRKAVLERTKLLAGSEERADRPPPVIGTDWFLAWNRRMAHERDLEQLLFATIDKALEITSAQAGFLVLAQGDEIHAQVARGLDHDTMHAQEAHFSRTIVREAIRSGALTVTADATRDPRFARAESVRELTPRSILCVPLTVEGLDGALYLSKDDTRSGFDEFDTQAASALVDQASIAVTNLRQHADVERLNRRLEERVAFRENELVRVRSLLRHSGSIPPIGDLIGESPAMEALFERVGRLAPTDLPIFLTGPRGTEVMRVARAIHEHSSRSARPFLSLNIAALPTELVEEELFGYAKGAFEGAGRNRQGVLARADRGTVFLDGVEELPRAAQARLLIALEQDRIRPVGSRKTRRINVRLVAGAAVDTLEARMRSGDFDAELFHLIRTVEIEVPSLADRVDDVPILVRRAVDDLNAKHSTAKSISDEVVVALTRRSWPGELRELSNEVARLYFLSDEAIDRTELVRSAGEQLVSIDPMPSSYRLEDLERAAIARALDATGQNKERAAKLLGISRAGLYKKLARLGLHGVR